MSERGPRSGDEFEALLADIDQRLDRLPPSLRLRGRLADLICRNLEGFGISAFVPGHIDNATLDELGRYLPGRSRSLPASLRRAYYRPQRPTP